MTRPRTHAALFALAAAVAALAFVCARAALSSTAHPSRATNATSPWTAAQIIQPAELASKINHGKRASGPIVVCAGFHTLYEGAHVPGAYFEGPASSRPGLDSLKKWARSQPRSAEIVVYCGCCPMDHCPNIRPAFAALKSMGFRRLRVLDLPQDFAHDWVAKGLPIAKGAQRH